MTKPQNSVCLRRVWPALETLHGLSAVRAEWQDLLGSEYALVEPLLLPQRDLATSYPRIDLGGAGPPLRVVDHGDGEYVAVCDMTGDTTRVSRQDLVVYAIDRRKLVQKLAAAFDLEPYVAQASSAGPIPIGQFHSAAGTSLKVFLCLPRQSADLAEEVTQLVAGQPPPFVILAPTTKFLRPGIDATLSGHGAGFLALSDTMLVDAKGNWTASPQAIARVQSLATPVRSEEPLSERAQLVLVAMLELGATDSDARCSTEDIAAKALGNAADANSLKSVMDELRTREFVSSKTGRGGGCWLTETGRSRAEKLRRQ